MYSTTTFATTWAGMSSDTGYVVGLVVVSIVTGTVALLGLGFGIRHLKRYITGKKF